MYHVAFATGSRADYSIVRKYLHMLQQDPEIEINILVTGALLDEKYGHQVDLIVKDGFHVATEIKLPLDASSNRGVLHAMACALDSFGELFETEHYDLLILLGDRYEILSVATAAAMQRIPILHLHGGEATYGNYDEFIRNAITKMSLFHFTATQTYRQRVIQMGEAPERVFYLGALGAENCTYIDENNVPEFIKTLPEKKYFVVLFHPETLTETSTLVQINELLAALSFCRKEMLVFLGTNADTASDIIRNRVSEFVNKNKNAVFFENLHSDAYHYLLKHAICLVGNSSSGIIEAPSLGIYTVNIGDRQKGRERGTSVIDVACKCEDIRTAMESLFEKQMNLTENPYYLPRSANLYYQKTKEILLKLVEKPHMIKQFYDIDFNHINRVIIEVK